MRYSHSTTKFSTNIPQGVGADSSYPYPSINKNVYIRYQIRISTLLNIYIHFNSHAFPSPITWVFTDMRARWIGPYSCLYPAITLLTDWNNVANILQNIHIQLRISQRTPTKTPNEHSARYFYQFIAPVSSTKTIGFGVRNTMCCRNNMACIVLVK